MNQQVRDLAMETFQEHLKPLYCLARFFGIFHFDLYKKRKNKISARVLNHFWSMPYAVYNIILLIWEVNVIFYSNLSTSNTKIKFRETTFVMLCCIKILVDYIWYIVKRNKIQKLLNDIGKLYNISWINSNSKVFKYQIIAVCIIVSTLWIILVITNVTKNVPLGWMNEIIFMGFMNCVMYNITKHVKELFASVNHKLSDFKIFLPSDEVITILKRCTETHFKLSEISRHLNSAFALPILGNALITFSLIILFTYCAIIKAHHLPGSLSLIYEILKNISCCFIVAFQLLLMVYSWDSVAKEANKTGLLVHKLWNQFQEHGQISSSNEDEIDTISLQLLQNKVKFTVCRFVDLDWSLIHLVIQTTTMYLVWIIQLKT